MNREKEAFTIMEVVVVVVIVTLVMSIGITSYVKSIERADEKTVISNLQSIRSAIEIYTNAGYTVGNWIGIDAINSALHISLMDANTNTVYQCNAVRCVAIHPKGWRIRFNLPNNPLVCVVAAPDCPTCPDAGVGNCG